MVSDILCLCWAFSVFYECSEKFHLTTGAFVDLCLRCLFSDKLLCVRSLFVYFSAVTLKLLMLHVSVVFDNCLIVKCN